MTLKITLYNHYILAGIPGLHGGFRADQSLLFPHTGCNTGQFYFIQSAAYAEMMYDYTVNGAKIASHERVILRGILNVRREIDVAIESLAGQIIYWGFPK
ncbi:MAG: hypothetical protein GY795_43255 [Desulfobacterales bacterium]|nr:hypothetical protein [Desulfobacterales bacterium]